VLPAEGTVSFKKKGKGENDEEAGRDGQTVGPPRLRLGSKPSGGERGSRKRGERERTPFHKSQQKKGGRLEKKAYCVR